MPVSARFDLEIFKARNGWLVRDVEIVRERAFEKVVDGLDERDGPVRFGPFAEMDVPAWGYLLGELAAPSPLERVRLVDVAPIQEELRDVLRNGGFPDEATVGTMRDDRLRGSREADYLEGANGDDRLVGRGGADALSGGAHHDRLVGGGGSDVLSGGRGRDLLKGGAGKDVLSGGIGNDRLLGGGGADTFLFDEDDFGTGGRVSRDRILDFDPTENDQIVDLTGALEIVAVGRIDDFGRRMGTLLEHAETGDRVFVAGARLSEDDILTRYAEPPTPRPSAEIAPFAVTVEEVSVIDQAAFRFGTWRVSIENVTARPVFDLEALSFVYGEAGAVIVPTLPGGNPTDGVAYRDGTFFLERLPDGPRPPLMPEETRALFTFTWMVERGADGTFPEVRTTARDFRPEGFMPFDPNDPPDLSEDLPIAVEVTIFPLSPGPGPFPARQEAMAEVFVTNELGFPLASVEHYAFAFDDPGIALVGDPWGATWDGEVFALAPWPSGDPHGTIADGERAKVFGFSYTMPLGADPSLSADDFSLVV